MYHKGGPLISYDPGLPALLLGGALYIKKAAPGSLPPGRFLVLIFKAAVQLLDLLDVPAGFMKLR